MLFANVCARFISSYWGEPWVWCFVHMGSVSPVVYKTWVTLVCLLLDTPFGRRSVGALPCLTAHKTAFQYLGIFVNFFH